MVSGRGRGIFVWARDRESKKKIDKKKQKKTDKDRQTDRQTPSSF